MVQIREHVILAPYTTFQIGGEACYFCEVRSESEVSEAHAFAEEHNLPLFVLGGGSNVLIADAGFDGLVVRMAIEGFDATMEGDRVIVKAGAGLLWDECVLRSIEHGWSGLEALSGIPGTVGASPVQNIGAYGKSASDAIFSVDAYDTHEHNMRTFTRDECLFDYRGSMFKKKKNRYIITYVSFQLSRVSTSPIPSYHDLQVAFNGVSGDVSIVDIRKAVIEARAKKGMALVPGYECFKSAGSFFKNPIIEPDLFARVVSIVRAHPDGSCTDPWFWTQADGQIKVSAACLFECAGFAKGYQRGSAGVSPRHALALINTNKAKADDILGLASDIKKKIRDLFGVDIEEEVQCIGF